MIQLIAKKLLPLIRSSIRSFVTLVIIASLGISALVSLTIAYKTLDTSLDNYLEEARYPDGVISFEAMSVPAVSDVLSTIDDITSWEARFTMDVEAQTSAENIVTIRIFAESDGSFNKRHVIEEKANDTNLPSLSLERKFAENNTIQAGDTLSIDLSGSTYTFFVSEIVASPECINISRNAYTSFELTDFGYAYADYDTIMNLLGLENSVVNQVSFATQADVNGEYVAEKILDALDSSDEASSWEGDDSPVIQAIEASVEPLHTLTFSVPPLLFLAALLLSSLFFFSLIKTRRAEIGILMALGFEARHIICLYISYAITIALFGGILGTLSGIALGIVISNLYAASLDIPNIILVYPPRIIVAALLISILVLTVAALLSTHQIVSIEPSEAMRAHTPTTIQTKERGAQPKISQTPLPPFLKTCISSIGCHKGRFALGVACLTVSCGLILLSLTFSTSLNGALERTYNTRYDFDCQVFLDEALSIDELNTSLENIEEITAAEPALLGSITIEGSGASITTLLQGILPNTDLINLEDPNGNSLTIPESGIILAEATAQALGISVGDTITIGINELRVEGISRQNLNFTQYCSLDQAAQLLGVSESANSILVCSSMSKQELSTALRTLPSFSYCSFTSTQETDARSQLEVFNAGVVLIVAFAIVIGYAIVHNLSTIMLVERKQEFATLKALGCSDVMIVFGTFIERIVQLLIACVLGLTLGNAGGTLLMEAMNSDLIMYVNENSFSTFLIAVLLTVSFAFIAHSMAMKSIQNMDLVATLKEYD